MLNVCSFRNLLQNFLNLGIAIYAKDLQQTDTIHQNIHNTVNDQCPIAPPMRMSEFSQFFSQKADFLVYALIIALDIKPFLNLVFKNTFLQIF